jgi:predicted kinase
MTQQPLLVVLAGLPGSGKTTLARELARRLGAAMLRVDAVEAAVVRCGLAEHPVGVVGYAVLFEVAGGCLDVGTPVVLDAVNPIAVARREWRDLAAQHAAACVMVEVQPPPEAEHRRRVEERISDVEGLVLPTWDAVRAHDYRPWDEQRDGPRVVVDGAAPTEESVAAVLAAIDRVAIR